MARQRRHTRAASEGSLSKSEDEAHDHGFFDDEALESAQSTDEGSDSDEEEIDPFPFNRLPPELRVRVWTLFCPDLLGAPRVLDFNLDDSLSPTRSSPCRVVTPGLGLEDQTCALRCVMATNQESRAIAKSKFPDDLLIEDNGQDFTLCANLKTDIAMLDCVPNFPFELGILTPGTTTQVRLDGFSQFIANLALPLHDANFFAGAETDVTSWLRKFRSLQRVFFYTEEERCSGNSLRWCASRHARQYYIETFQKEPGYGEDFTKLVCWPDAQRNPSFTKAHVPKWATTNLTSIQKAAFQDAGVNIYPMVVFDTEAGLELFDKHVATDYLPLKVYDANHDGSDGESETEESDIDEDFEPNGVIEEADAYESDGIDDDEPEIFHESGDEHLDDGRSDDSDDSDGARVPPNQFSSPEPSEDEAGSSVRGRKRRILVDSDDDDGDEPITRPAKRKRVHVLDSDDEPGPAEAAESQASSSDEDEDSGPAKRRKVEVVDIPDSDDGDDSDDSSEEDDDQPQRTSLAGRLQIRGRSRRSPSDEEDSEGEEEEDDEGDEDDEEDEEDGDGNGLIDGMAVESGEDEDEDDEEEDEDEEDEEDE
ncbi:hypothetical protein ISF_06340 [Cordyceps fumosorosea ARSEF 2679]|uniref:2EXR domain-containing protein n=1 Tax=Cordyceps fumosorosea (strain ARSEF 2679) TaxID=1081104 RepID=A0A167S9S7_CORFA|nr:hypothetical protein ISF_06340 [Cordyceps fumosorosea ARSEF 2679]OAA59405.1 hypothetical protein ISF_06340 [Cordyceps fumosorosea ARSEF 2679]